MLHSGPAKPHLARSLRCCCLRAVSAYQVQLAVWADAADAPAANADTSDKTTTHLLIGILPGCGPIKVARPLAWVARRARWAIQGALEACADRLSSARCCSA